MLPQVSVDINAMHIAVINRTCGGLTGSRVAGLLVRIPVETVVAYVADLKPELTFAVNGRRLAFCTYVDNIYSAARTVWAATMLCNEVQDRLKTEWNFDIKPDSKEVIRTIGPDAVAADSSWIVQKSMPALGHTLSEDGSVRACWKATKSCMWRSFFANIHTKRARCLQATSRLQLLQRSVLHIFLFRAVRWPPQKTIALEVDALQRSMVAMSMRVPRGAGEPVDQYCRRRAIAAGVVVRRGKTWSQLWFAKSLLRGEHIARDSARQTAVIGIHDLSNAMTNFSWSGALYTTMDAQFFMDRRVMFAGRDDTSTSSHRGRTRTTHVRRGVSQRWHDRVAHARNS
jgi:hypothetical protein